MGLAAPVEHGSDQGNPDTSAHVARQIHQAGSSVVLVARQERVRRRVDGDEQERHAHRLEDACHHGGAKIDFQVKVGHVKQRSGQHDQAEQQQPARAVAR